MSDTPETDNLARGNHVVPTEFAQELERDIHNLQDQRDFAISQMKRLERERDEARRLLAAAKESLNAIHVEVGGWIAAIMKEAGK